MEITVKNGKKAFGENIVFEDINLNFKTGNFYLIKGYNGSGKTVLLKAICGYMFLTNGEIFQNNIRIRDKNNYIQDAGF